MLFIICIEWLIIFGMEEYLGEHHKIIGEQSEEYKNLRSEKVMPFLDSPFLKPFGLRIATEIEMAGTGVFRPETLQRATEQARSILVAATRHPYKTTFAYTLISDFVTDGINESGSDEEQAQFLEK